MLEGKVGGSFDVQRFEKGDRAILTRKMTFCENLAEGKEWCVFLNRGFKEK